jgi:hypothetical protein
MSLLPEKEEEEKIVTERKNRSVSPAAAHVVSRSPLCSPHCKATDYVANESTKCELSAKTSCKCFASRSLNTSQQHYNASTHQHMDFARAHLLTHGSQPRVGDVAPTTPAFESGAASAKPAVESNWYADGGKGDGGTPGKGGITGMRAAGRAGASASAMLRN